MTMDFLEKNITHEKNVETSWLYALFAANLYRFCPHINTVEYPAIYRRLVTSKYRASDDQQSRILPVKQEVLADLRYYIQRIKDRPGIIATFHTGSYRLLNRVMCMQGLRVAVVMSREIIVEQGEHLLEQHAAMEDAGDLQLIDADAGNCLIRILGALRNGYHVLVYMDGNHGAAPTKEGTDSEEVPFFNCNLFVRKGLAVLSHKRAIPIYPILSSLDEKDDTFYRSYAAISPESDELLEHYTSRVFRTLYTHLQEVISHKPELWEGWLYVHTMPGKKERSKMRRKYQSYWPCHVGTRYYMMISPRYTCQEIGKMSFFWMRKWKRLTKQMKI